MKIRTGKDSSLYCISTAFDSRKSHYYIAAIKRQGLIVSKSFVPAHYGDAMKALAAAQAWRDRVLSLLPPMTSRELRTLVRRSNRSGIPGVHRYEETNGIAYWKARTSFAEKTVSRKFSVAKHGEEAARQMAIAAREKMLLMTPARFNVPTTTGQALSRQVFGDPETLCDDIAVTWDASARARFLERLRAEGLIETPGLRPAGLYVYRLASPSLPSPRWSVFWVDPTGQRRVRTFSVAKYGEVEAERLARQVYDQVLAAWQANGGVKQGPTPSAPRQERALR